MFNNLVIFEMANNHQGSVKHGLKIIDTYSDISKNLFNPAIKLQYRDLNTFISKNKRERSLWALAHPKKRNWFIDKFNHKWAEMIVQYSKDTGQDITSFTENMGDDDGDNDDSDDFEAAYKKWMMGHAMFGNS